MNDMTKKIKIEKNENILDEKILSRYESARRIAQGFFSEELVKNATVFPNWIKESNSFWYRRSSKEGREFRLVNSNDATNRLAFDHVALANALSEKTGCDVNPKNLPIANDVIFTLEPTKIDFSALGRRWIYEEKTKNCKLLNDNDLEGFLVSPDGKKAVFENNNNLWLHDTDSGEKKAITHDGEEFFVYGAPGSVWGREVERGLQASWSPDSKKLFTVQRDTRQVKSLPVLHHIPSDGSLRPTVNYVKLAYPGDASVEEYRLVVIDIDSGIVTEANYRHIPVVRNGWGFFNAGIGWWSKDSRIAYFIDQERGDQVFRVVEFDTISNSTRILIEEKTDTHLRISPNLEDYPLFKYLIETNELIWWSERSGWGHLYLYDLNTGKLKNSITSGSWLVRDVLYVDTSRRELFIQTAGRVASRDPYYRDIARVNIDTGDMTTLTDTDHEYIVMQAKSYTGLGAMAAGYDCGNGVSTNGEFVVTTRTRADEASVSILLDRNGKEILNLEVADVSELPNNWKWPEPVKLLAADGVTDIYGLVFRPSDFSPEESYPVVTHTMNTGEWTWVSKGSFNTGSCNGVPYVDAAALAELGFIVVQIEGRGTSCRSKAFRDESYGWAPSINCLEDHVAGLQQLAARYDYIDLDRVGITEHMGSSSGAIFAIVNFPDFYKVAVSGTTHDSRLSAAPIYGDIFEGVARKQVDNQYAETLAKNFKGKLMLIANLLDTTCPPAGTLRVLEALQNVNKDVDLLLMPSLGHFPPGGYVLRRAWDYLLRNLRNEEPPIGFELSTTMDILVTGNTAFNTWSEDMSLWTTTD